MEERPRRQPRKRGGLVGPVFLIGLGVVFLLTNLGLLEVNVWWTLLRIWPVFLIAAGIDLLIGRRSILGTLVALVLIVGVFAGAFWLAQTGAGVWIGSEQEISQPLEGATAARIEIAPTAAVLRLEALSDSADLVRGVVRPASGEKLERDFAIEDGTADLILRTDGGIVRPFAGMGSERSWDLGLSADLPIDLTVDFGVGLADVDLVGLMIEGLDVDYGIGQTTVSLPREGSFKADVEGAIGQVVIVLPSGMEACIHFDTALVARSVPADYDCADDVCTSPGYVGADHRVDLDVGLAIGNVSVRQLADR